MPQIHPSAVVEHGANLAEGVVVGPLCYVGPKVTIGSGTHLISHVAVLGRTTLGCNNTIWPHVTLGGKPQDLKYKGEDSELVIGDNNDIRESVTIHLGTENGGGITSVGDDNLIMVGVHVAHDCRLGNFIILSNSVQLAGHIHIEDHAWVGGATAIHHFVTIGQYSFVGGMARIVKDVPPFMLVEGNPAIVRKVNTIGLERHQIRGESIESLKDAHRRLFRINDDDNASNVRNISETLEKLEADYPDDEYIALLVQFMRNTNIGLYGRYQESQRADNRHQTPTR